MKSWIFPDQDAPHFLKKFAALAAVTLVINLALLGAAVWIVVKVLQWTGVIS